MFSLFSRRERIRRVRLWRENSPSPAEEAVASFKVRSPKSAIFGGEKYTIVFLRRGFPSFCGRASRSRARLTRKNSPLPPSFARFTSLIRKMRTPHFRGNAWQKCDFAALYYTFLGAASRCRAILTRKNSPLPPSLARITSLIRKMRTAHFRGYGVENAIFNALIRLFLMRRRQP